MTSATQGTRVSRAGVLARQALIVVAGFAVAALMLTLGLWQMQRSIESGEAGIAARAAEPASPLLDHIHRDGTFDDIYGKPVTVTGRYLPEQQLLVVGSDGTARLLTAFQVPDGRVVPVVRGRLAAASATPPTASSEPRTITGLFLPGEADDSRPMPAGRLASVRMPLLAQVWPQQVTPGFVTLDAAGAAAEGLTQASVTLPQGEKSLQNGSYAIQWWIFAAVAVGVSLKVAQVAGRRSGFAPLGSRRIDSAEADQSTPPHRQTSSAEFLPAGTTDDEAATTQTGRDAPSSDRPVPLATAGNARHHGESPSAELLAGTPAHDRAACRPSPPDHGSLVDLDAPDLAASPPRKDR